MVRIFTDSSCMLSNQEAKKLGVRTFPLQIIVKGKSYRDLEDLDSDTLLAWIKEGNIPTSSQPVLGEVVESYDAVKDDEILQICMADGLSGTYQSALIAQNSSTSKDRITVFNSRTLCGPQKYLVELAAKMADDQKPLNEIINHLEECLDDCQSYLLPSDFSFLKRGGRMTALAAAMGGLLRIHPIVMQTKDGQRLDKFHVARTFSSAIDRIVSEFQKAKLDARHRIFVSHADAKEKCDIVIKKLREVFPVIEIESIALSPAMITQGGPGCVAVQYIRK